MIEIKEVVKDFDGFRALDGLNMRIEDGCIYGLVGPNGAGKSTVIRHIMGVYKATEGQVLVDGESSYENPIVKQKTFYIPDELFCFGNCSVEEMGKFFSKVYDFDWDRFERIRPAFEKIDSKKNIAKLSKGMQKQAIFWLALSCRPKYLILDEPVDGLDPVMRRQIWSLLVQDVAEQGTTVLISSHNLRELEDVCDTVGIINKGKMVLEKSLSSLQGETKKMQIGFSKGKTPDFIAEGKTGEVDTGYGKINILHSSNVGNIYTLIVKDTEGKCTSLLEKHEPVLFDQIPLTLEEIFIYELGGEDYEIKEIVL